MSGPIARRPQARPRPSPSASALDDAMPVDEDGWQLIDLRRSLFPGGPEAHRAVSPRLAFCFGLDLAPTADGTFLATVSQLGRPSVERALPKVLTTPELVEEARSHVRAYLLRYWRAYRPRPIADVVFVSGSGRLVDVF